MNEYLINAHNKELEEAIPYDERWESITDLGGSILKLVGAIKSLQTIVQQQDKEIAALKKMASILLPGKEETA